MLQGATAFDFGRVPISIRGMGAASYVPPTECEQYGSTPPPGCPGYKAPATTNTGSFWDKANSFLTKNSGALTDIVSAFKNKPASGGGLPDPPKSNTMKYVLIGGGLLAVTGIIILATRKKKKSVSGLGDLNTAKTAKGKKKQRAAVFAKLDEEGNAWPKNSAGKRARKKKKK